MPGSDAPRHVLVIDDNADIRLLYKMLLERDGFEVTTSATGRHALKEVADRTPDVVLLDLGLPDMDGFDLVAKLRTEAGLTHQIIIACTGRHQKEIAERYEKTGFSGYFQKGSDTRLLLAMLDDPS